MLVQKRKPGRKKESVSDESIKKLSNQILMSIRRDYGGKDHTTVLQNKLEIMGLPLEISDCAIVDQVIYNVLRGFRTRIAPRINELVRRAEGK